MKLMLTLADLGTHWPGKPERSLADELDLLKSSYDSPETHLSSAGTYVMISGGQGAARWNFSWRITDLEVDDGV